MTDKW